MAEVPTGVVSDRLSRKWSLLLASMYQTLAVAGFILAPDVVLLANAPVAAVLVGAFVCLKITGGVYGPFRARVMHERISSDKRATIGSFMTMGFKLTGPMIVPAFGHLADTNSVRLSMQVFQFAFIFLLAIGVLWGWRAFREERAAGSSADNE